MKTPQDRVQNIARTMEQMRRLQIGPGKPELEKRRLSVIATIEQFLTRFAALNRQDGASEAREPPGI